MEFFLFLESLFGGDDPGPEKETFDKFIGQINKSNSSIEDKEYPSNNSHAQHHVHAHGDSLFVAIEGVLGEPDVTDEDPGRPHCADANGEEEGPEDAAQHRIIFIRLIQEHVKGHNETGKHVNDNVHHHVQN